MQKNAKNTLPVNSGTGKTVRKSLSAIYFISILILGGYSGMWANSFFNQEHQGYDEIAIHIEKAQPEKVHKNEPAKQKTEALQVVIAGAGNTVVADDLKILNISDIIASFIGYPYLTLQSDVGKRI